MAIASETWKFVLLNGSSVVSNDHRAQANAIRYQLKSLYNLTVIEAMADFQFLPHYGFPIGLHKLRVVAPDEENPMQVREEDQYRLERGNMLALREYVPGSQLMVGGKTITSHGLLKHWTGENLDDSLGLRGQSSRCREGHFYYWLSDPPESCPICGEAQGSSPMDLLFPKHWFSSAAWDPPKWGTEIDIIGDVQTATLTFASQDRPSHQLVKEDFGGIRNLTARYQEDGELLVYNAGAEHKGFAVCLSCGFSQSEESIAKGAVDLPRGFDRHAPLTSVSPFRSCW